MLFEMPFILHRFCYHAVDAIITRLRLRVLAYTPPGASADAAADDFLRAAAIY